jgi:hypothetical protein
MSLPEVAPQHPLTASHSLLQKGVSVPYPSPSPSEDSNWKVSFQKPQSISLVGAWITKLLVKKKDDLPYVIDLAVEMPDVCFVYILPESYSHPAHCSSRYFRRKTTSTTVSSINARIILPPLQQLWPRYRTISLLQKVRRQNMCRKKMVIRH